MATTSQTSEETRAIQKQAPTETSTAALSIQKLISSANSNLQVQYRVPVEIWKQIFSDKDLSFVDLKNVRLTCKMLAQIPLGRLFNTCVIKRDRSDFSRLETMLFHGKEQFAQDIRTLRFEAGCVDPNSMGHNLILTKFRDHDDRRYHETMNEYVSWYYKVWKNRDDPISGHHISSDKLGMMLAALKGVDRIDIMMSPCPLKSRPLIEAWKEGTWDTHFQHDIANFQAILEAILTQNSSVEGNTSNDIGKLKHLTHDALPPVFFDTYSNSRGISAFRDVCGHLETLHLNFGAQRVLGENLFLKQLAKCLKQATNLLDLRLGLDPSYRLHSFEVDAFGQEHTVNVDAFWSSPGCWCDFKQYYVPLYLMFPKKGLWKNLTSLRFEGLFVCEHGLEHVVLELQSLKRLYFCQIGLLHGTWETLLSKIRKTIRLEHFGIWGEIMSLHGHEENWVLPPPAHFWQTMMGNDAPGTQPYLESYRQIMSGDRPNQTLQVQTRERMEAFVLGHGRWPRDLLEDIYLPFPRLEDSDRDSDEEDGPHGYCKQQQNICEQNFERIREHWTESISEEELADRSSDINPFDYRADNMADFPLLVDDHDIYGANLDMTNQLPHMPTTTAKTIRSLVCDMSRRFKHLQLDDMEWSTEGTLGNSHTLTVNSFNTIYAAHPELVLELQEEFFDHDCSVDDADNGGR